MSGTKTLLFIFTHIINEQVIKEYSKLESTQGYDCLLAIDNTNLKIPFRSRICKKKFYGKNVNCFMIDEKVHKELNLPYFVNYTPSDNFGCIMWYNCDYSFYYVKKYFPNYEYYWRFEYDVFCNDDSYKLFLDKYKHKKADALLVNFAQHKKNDPWCWTSNIDWIYNDETTIYGFFFPVCRLSSSAVDFLYKKRLEQAKIFDAQKTENNLWTHCELFVPTELMNNNFSCYNMEDEKNITLEEFDLKSNPIFEKPNGVLYHRIKSTNKYFSINLRISILVSKIKRLLFLLCYICR